MTIHDARVSGVEGRGLPAEDVKLAKEGLVPLAHLLHGPAQEKGARVQGRSLSIEGFAEGWGLRIEGLVEG